MEYWITKHNENIGNSQQRDQVIFAGMHNSCGLRRGMALEFMECCKKTSSPYSQIIIQRENFTRSNSPKLKNEKLGLDFPWMSHPDLPRMLSFEEYKEYLDLLQDFATMMEAAKVRYVMFFGTLLGSYRMHNMLPWDDDLDLIVNYDDMCKVIEAVQKQTKHNGDTYFRAVAHYHKYQQKKPYDNFDFQDLNCSDLSDDNMFHNFKFFAANATVDQKGWKWPFLDMFLFQENQTHVWILWGRKRTVYIKREHFYPLITRPLGRLWLPSPRDGNFSLHVLYEDFEVVCATGTWDHRRGRPWAKGVQLKCDDLRQYYPFVHRRTLPQYTEEQLVFKEEILHTVFIG